MEKLITVCVSYSSLPRSSDERIAGYWPLNFNALNSHFGTQQDLQDLAAALHAKGMYLMVDIVINHMAATAVPPTLTDTGYTPYNQPAVRHPCRAFVAH